MPCDCRPRPRSDGKELGGIRCRPVAEKNSPEDGRLMDEVVELCGVERDVEEVARADFESSIDDGAPYDSGTGAEEAEEAMDKAEEVLEVLVADAAAATVADAVYIGTGVFSAVAIAVGEVEEAEGVLADTEAAAEAETTTETVADVTRTDEVVAGVG